VSSPSFKLFKSAGDTVVGATAIFPTLDGGDIFIQGEFTNSPDLYFHKTNAGAIMQWSNAVRKPGAQFIHRLVENRDGSYVGACDTNNDILFLRLDTLGRSFRSDSSVVFQHDSSVKIMRDVLLSGHDFKSISITGPPLLF
jgi:hypothetical protein